MKLSSNDSNSLSSCKNGFTSQLGVLQVFLIYIPRYIGLLRWVLMRASMWIYIILEDDDIGSTENDAFVST